MNSKLIKACLAGTAAIAVAAGGTTFAAWSDFATSSTLETGAGSLVLDLGSGETHLVGAADRLSLAPGENSLRDYWVASNAGDSVPNGDLFITPQIISDNEDGCTSSSEPVAQATGYPGSDCSDTSAPGQFSDQVRVTISSSAPFDAASPPDCKTVPGGYTAATTVAPVGANLNDKDGVQHLVASDLEPGKGVCVRMLYLLPDGATNSVQGDSTDHNNLFDLVQS